jgi:hypothetical protein
MSSQFNNFLASSHRADLHRNAERSRRTDQRRETVESPFPTMLRTRRLGRLLRVVPSPSRRSA